jgi:phasin family protein
MMSSDQRKPGEKSSKRKQKKAKKAEQRSTAPERVQAASEPVETAIAPESVEAAIAPETEEVVAPEVVESGAAVDVAPAEPVERVERVASFRERMASVMPPADIAPARPVTPAAPPDIAPAVPSPATAPAAGIQAIANAYRDYTRKSLEDAQSFAEKLTTARSLDKAVEAQTEFARQACENFADNSRKIRELQRELFWQAFRLPTWGRTQR